MLCDHATALVTESNRSSQTRQLIQYNSNTIRSIIRESHSLSEQIVQSSAPYTQIQAPLEVTAEMSVNIAALRRNQRALYVYHYQRVELIKNRFWDKGGLVGVAFGSDNAMRKNMSKEDEEFASGYSQLCIKLKSQSILDPDSNDEDELNLTDALDLLSGGVDVEPPKELYVSVRVLGDVGEVESADGGVMSLSKGSQYFLAREDVENLVVRGSVEVIE